MARGGNGKPDDFSPYKTSSGRTLKLLKSKRSKNGYWCVGEPHPGKFYPKKKVDVIKGAPQKYFGKASATAREAAIILAEFEDAPYELPSVKKVTKLTEEEKSKELDKLLARARELLGENNKTEEEKAAAEADAAEFHADAAAWAQWKEAKRSVRVLPDPPEVAQPAHGNVLRCWVDGKEEERGIVVVQP